VSLKYTHIHTYIYTPRRHPGHPFGLDVQTVDLNIGVYRCAVRSIKEQVMRFLGEKERDSQTLYEVPLPPRTKLRGNASVARAMVAESLFVPGMLPASFEITTGSRFMHSGVVDGSDNTTSCMRLRASHLLAIRQDIPLHMAINSAENTGARVYVCASARIWGCHSMCVCVCDCVYVHACVHSYRCNMAMRTYRSEQLPQPAHVERPSTGGLFHLGCLCRRQEQVRRAHGGSTLRDGCCCCFCDRRRRNKWYVCVYVVLRVCVCVWNHLDITAGAQSYAYLYKYTHIHT
jgi:hypothetical protein